MLKNYNIKKLNTIILVIFSLLLIYIMPSNKEEDNYKVEKNNLEYTYSNKEEVIYLIDSKDYVARTTIKDCNCSIKDKVKDIIEGLTIDGKKNNTIPNGFRSIIPSGTEILDINIENKLLTINFSKDILDINEKYEEKMIEAIVFSLTSLDDIDKIIIKVEGKILDKLPISGKNIPIPLDKSYGINKKYDITTTKDIDFYTTYYVSIYNDNKYYVPVTKYINKDEKDKIKVIINELATSPIYETNLMSYLNSNISLLDYKIDNQKMELNFNNAILPNKDDKILEEVIYTISLSMNDNYNIKEVSFLVNNKEIYKNSIKSIE